MPTSDPHGLSFGPFSVDVRRRVLLMDGTRIELGSRAFDILVLLIEARGELVSKSELIRRVWGEIIVEENTLQSHVWALRNALGKERDLILTVSGRGYRFVGQLREVEESEVGQTRGRVSPAAPRAMTNLPSMVSPLIGRSRDLAKLIDLARHRRLLTLAGAGGIGKTRLTLEAARRLLPHFPDGVWLTELASLSDPQSISAAVVAAMGLQISTPELSATRLGAAFGSKRMLLVLDNCEHIIDAAAKFIEELLCATPALQIVATSREPLGIEGEQVYQVAPLSIPPEQATNATEVLAYEAAQFFYARVREADHTFSLDDVNACAVGAICRCLDGLPLALELAAPRAAALGVTTVAARLDQVFDLLLHGRRTSPPRHRTLRATLEWSYELLSEDECRVLRRLSVFSGGFTLDAACALAGDGPSGHTAVTDCIARLVAKSFIETAQKEPLVRYRLLQTTRTYLLERLAESDDGIDAYRRRHAEYFRDLLTAAAHASLANRPRLETIGSELDNVRAALSWAFLVPDDSSLSFELAVRSAPVWLGMSLLNECRSWMEKALCRLGVSRSAGTRDEVILRSALALTLTILGATATAIRTALGDVCELAKKLGEKDCYVNALYATWFAHYRGIDVRAMFATAHRLQCVVAEMGSEILISFAERILGTTEQLAGDHFNAGLHLARSIERREQLRQHGHTAHFVFDNLAGPRSALANSLWLQGLPDQAAATAERSFNEARATGDASVLCHTLLYCIHFALKVGDMNAADLYATELMTRADQLSSDVYRSFALGTRGILMARRGERASGLPLLQTTMQEFQRLEHVFFYTILGGDLADILREMGRTQESQAVVDGTLRQVRRGGADILLPELLRVQGELYAIGDDGESVRLAEVTLLESIDLAHRQNALSFELRASMSMAWLRHKQARDAEAIEALAPVYLKFQEGFATRDLKLAKALLEQLGWQAGSRGLERSAS